MKRKKLLFSAIAALTLVTGAIIYAADHIDAPSVTNQTTGITDLYVFQGANASDLVFVANTQGLLTPATTGAAKFDENTLIEFNIDNNFVPKAAGIAEGVVMLNVSLSLLM
jgi:Domain of unknown function (DUF4331)